ncbi:uncharacterized protein LOC129890045 [Solanum dulcamara]|uniref:uncharacterized protein LOC129890045 n=1 Tax=Solanum dulcamara TaxID=45834 RepID=UPI002486BAC3|nr:uncharacterized protein LOC129890045 [Solanum dulcamara]
MNLVIEILTGTLFHIRVTEDISVADLKREISNQEKLPENRLILMLDTGDGDSIMFNDDEIPLAEYGVKDGSHFYLFFKLPNNNNNNNNGDGDNVSIVNPETPVSQGHSVASAAKWIEADSEF